MSEDGDNASARQKTTNGINGSAPEQQQPQPQTPSSPSLAESIKSLLLHSGKVLLRSGQFAIYQIIPSVPSTSSADNTMNGTSPTSLTLPTAASTRGSNSRVIYLHIAFAFVKIFSKTFEIQRFEPVGPGAAGGGGGGGGSSSGFGTSGGVGLGNMGGGRGGGGGGGPGGGGFSGGVNDHPSSSSTLVDNNDGTRTYTGVFFTGENPSWILSTDRGGIHMYPSGHSVVHAFTACEPAVDPRGSGRAVGGEFLVYSDEGPTLLEWIPGFEFEPPLPMRSIPRGRAYSSVVYDPSTSLFVAASVLEATFSSFDEEGNSLWEPDAPNISYPKTECSSLELISPDLSMDGFEFANNEIVNAGACVSLETTSTETGLKNFIAAGTTINRGEDLAIGGATYIFEIVEVLADSKLTPKRWYKFGCDVGTMPRDQSRLSVG
ncbi:hypothetical protein D9757_010765 [Collybiopsis confluens]|uniref:RSE1/DDB1/CPSF1 C-terminal domain-containing protein n=1 Tax=Collybiopsis confluens TaxID=2823264 RepID=A0A8H5H8L7_9AGAR|nr:hypothetical protein D9757_010765 [Collybiopsis confluens]